MNQDAATPRSSDIASQQLRLDAWRADFNTCRPHEALGQRCPASMHEPSARRYPEVLSSWDYPVDHYKRRVSGNGYIKWQDRPLYLTEALADEEVAVSRRDDGDWYVRFRCFDLAILGEDSGKLRRSGLARSGKPGTA